MALNNLFKKGFLVQLYKTCVLCILMGTLPKLVQFIFLHQTVVVSVSLKINKNPAWTSVGDSGRAAGDPSCLQMANEKKDVFFDNPLSPISAVWGYPLEHRKCYHGNTFRKDCFFLPQQLSNANHSKLSNKA